MFCQAIPAQTIEEVVVTARRQGEEKLMDVPLAITAFDASAIEAHGISSLQDVASLTPGLTFFNFLGEILPTPIIRGVVPQDILGENAAAIFIDGVFVPSREGLNFSQLDIERIEVMKGPQSSTYGRNAFSGAVNYVTRPPSDIFESKLEVEVGNRGKQKIMGQISGPIWSDKLTGRMSLLYDDWDGSYNNTIAPEKDIGGYRYRSYQGKLRWQPVDTLDITLALYHSNDDVDDWAAASVMANCEPRVLQTAEDVRASSQDRMMNWCGRLPRLKDLPDALDPATFDTTLYPQPLPLQGSIKRNGLPHIAESFGQRREMTRGNLNIVWETDYGSLAALTGYSYMRERESQDFNHSTGYAVPLVVCPSISNLDPPLCDVSQPWQRIPMGILDYEAGPRDEEWSQELRFTSRRDQRLRWQAGGYYYHFVRDDHDQGTPEVVGELPPWFDISATGNTAIGPITPPSLAIGSYIFGPTFAPNAGMDPLERFTIRERQKSWSLFGSMDLDITDRLRGRVEVRYTKDHRWSDGYNYTPCLSPTPGSAFPASIDIPVADCGDTFFDLRVLEPMGYDTWVRGDDNEFHPVHVSGVEGGSARFNTTTGRIGLDYRLDSGWMVYGSVAFGKKPGGIYVLPSMEVVDPTGAMMLSTVVNRFDPEKLTAWELGMKGYTPDRRIRVDMSLFYNNWRDIVLRHFTEVDPNTGLHFKQPQGLNVNSGNAHVYGWELTTDVALTDHLTGRLTAAYTESKMNRGKIETIALYPSFYITEPDCVPGELSQAEAIRCRQLSGDISGLPQKSQPPWTASLALDYKRQLWGEWDLISSISGTFTDKLYVSNDSQGWVPPRAVVNFKIGIDSPRYTLQLWVNNLFNDDKPISAYRDILWTNDADVYASIPTGSGNIRDISSFDDFPPIRMTVNYPRLRTWGLTARMRFGGELK